MITAIACKELILLRQNTFHVHMSKFVIYTGINQLFPQLGHRERSFIWTRNFALGLNDPRLRWSIVRIRGMTVCPLPLRQLYCTTPHLYVCAQSTFLHSFEIEENFSDSQMSCSDLFQKCARLPGMQRAYNTPFHIF